MFTKYNHSGQGYQINECLTPDVNNNTSSLNNNGTSVNGTTNVGSVVGSSGNSESNVASSSVSSSSTGTVGSSGSASFRRTIKNDKEAERNVVVDRVDDEETMNACYSINFDEADENSDSEHEFYASREGAVSTVSTGSPNVSGTSANGASSVDMVNMMVSGSMIMNNAGLVVGNGANNSAHFYNPHLHNHGLQPHHFHHAFNNSFNPASHATSSMSGIHYSSASSKRTDTPPTESPSSIDFGMPDSPKARNASVHCTKEKIRRDRIKVSCNQLRRLIPNVDGIKTDMASLLETSVLWAKLVNANVPEQYLRTIRAELATQATVKSSTTTTTTAIENTMTTTSHMNHLYTHQPQCNKNIDFMYMNNKPSSTSHYNHHHHHLHHSSDAMMPNVASSQMSVESKSNVWLSAAAAAAAAASTPSTPYNKFYSQNVSGHSANGTSGNVSLPIQTATSAQPTSQCFTTPSTSSQFGFYVKPGFNYPR